MNTPDVQPPEGGYQGNPQQDDNLYKPGMTRAIILAGVLIFTGFSFVFYKFYIDDIGVFENKEYAYEKADEYTAPSLRVDPVLRIDPDYRKKEEKQEVKGVFEEGADGFGTFVRASENSLKDYSVMFAEEQFSVDWLPQAKKVPTDVAENLFVSINDQHLLDMQALRRIGDESGEDVSLYEYHLYELGSLNAPSALAGRKLYLFTFPESGMGLHILDIVVLYDEPSKSFISIRKVEYDWSPSSYFFADKYIKGYINIALGPTAPSILDVPGTKSTLQYTGSYREDYVSFTSKTATNNRGGLANVITGAFSPTLTDESIEFVDPAYGPVHFVDNEYRIVLEDGSVHTYELMPSFLVKDPEAEKKNMYAPGLQAVVTWKETFSKGTNKYVRGGQISRAGCGQGIQRQSNIVTNAEWFDSTDLVEVGKTGSGDAVYILQDTTNNRMYLDFFAFGGSAGYMFAHPEMDVNLRREVSEETLYEEFLENDPIIFWQDYKNRWRMYFKSEYQSLAECGKPVIYLYPEETTDVRVEVDPNGGFTYTDPVYPEDGWVVRAEPNGSLYSYKERAEYPYLFWEGHADGFGFSDKGFVFSRDTLERDMQDLLTETGLNEQEIYDFLEFWLPLMKEKSYVFVTFANQHAFERAAPLTISPRPDSVLRVFMYFEPRDEYKKVDPLRLYGFERRGFSVVEWGGVLDRLK